VIYGYEYDEEEINDFNEVELSLPERTIIYNQLELLKAADYKHQDTYTKAQSILELGLENVYPQEVFLTYHPILKPKDTMKFVSNVLEMFVRIRRSYLKHNLDEVLKYDGFDSTDESDYYTAANFLFDNNVDYREIKKYHHNSFCNEGRYTDLLMKYKLMLIPSEYHLTVENLRNLESGY
jgi:uncharacterized protein YfbU (UPF0304 family)